MAGIKYKIILPRGNSINKQISLIKDGETYIPASGDVIKLTVVYDTTVILEKTIANDDIRLYLTHEDTKALRVGLYKYDMKIKYANGDVDDIISLSDLEITKSATDFD